MLRKLLKYDLKNTFKLLSVFYILAIFFAILTRIFLSIENSFVMDIIGKICSGTTIALMFNILINSIMRAWVRFKQSLYGDESYLTHTLPIDKKPLYNSKILTSLITLFISIAMIALILFIAYYSKENMILLKNLLLPVADIYETSIMKIIIAFLLIIFVEFAATLQSGFTGIILGHKMNNNKLAYSILFGFISYMVIQILGIITLFTGALFNSDLMNLFITNQMVNIDMIKIVIYLSIGFYSVSILIGYIFNLYMFKKGVNVD
ncbi:MAG: hypothetical protein IJZ46_05040 [Bacilli bacterium]|nr:hypothetical protein [Bacilli bacterium]